MSNKENYIRLIEDSGNNIARHNLLINNHNFIETI